MKKPRVYLAGPDLFFPDAEERYSRLKAMCTAHGLDGVAPTDGQTFPIERTLECARRIRHHDLATMHSCDAVLANITPFLGLEPDSGTSYEMGDADAHGMPVASYCTDGLDTARRAERLGRDLNLIPACVDVEDFGLYANLMLCAAHPAFETPDQAVEHLAATLREVDPRVAPRDAQREQVADLAMLVRRLVSDVRRLGVGDASATKRADQAMQYLQSNGLLGKPLRSADGQIAALDTRERGGS